MRAPVLSLGQWFKQHPCGRRCLERMSHLQGAELWNWPVTNCLFLEPTLAPVHQHPLHMIDLKTCQIVCCWAGVSESSVKGADKDGIWAVTGPVGPDSIDLETGEECLYETEFQRQWFEAVLAFNPEVSAQYGHILSRQPWCWSDEAAIVQILTEVTKQDLDATVSSLPPVGPESWTVRGWTAWDNWRRTQSVDVRTKLGDLVLRLVQEERYPVELTVL